MNSKLTVCSHDCEFEGDIFGAEPVYYYRTGKGELLVSGEIKSFFGHPDFIPQFNEDALLPYLTFQYSCLDETFYKGLFRLPPAHRLVFKGGNVYTERYYRFDFKPIVKPEKDYIDQIEQTIQRSVETRRKSGETVGAFLSGGIDSGYITSCVMPDKTFSVGFDCDNFDESVLAAELSKDLGIENHRRIITADDCYELLPEIISQMEEPLANPSCVPLYFLSQLASGHVKTVYTGEGADELFAGYDEYNDTAGIRKYKQTLPAFVRKFAEGMTFVLPDGRLKQAIIKGAENTRRHFIGQARVFEPEQAKSILKPKYSAAKQSVTDITARFYDEIPDADRISMMQHLDLNLWMPGDIMPKANRMSSPHGIEIIAPLLDKDVAEMACRLPADMKIRDGITKYALRRTAARKLPDQWANRIKKGFPVPIRHWLRQESFCNLVMDEFTSQNAEDFFYTKKLVKLLNDHYSGKKNNARKIWTAYIFLAWKRGSSL
ncbi:MAG: asparagine synthase (glutamine-hydrolyzing) [Oscillospiraceae bacterium]|nr:asparagine synthase (glutamine-hydrolyzing) [Oscillospiraceae bacterium]